MKKSLIFLSLVIAIPILAGLYGAIHDQVTYTLSPEYFTKFKYDQFGLEPQWFGGHRQTVAVIGILATWWTGIPIGIIVGIVALFHDNAKTMWSVATRSLLVILAVTALAGVLGFCYGFSLLDETLAWDFPADLIDKDSFILVASVHNFSYLGGFIGLMASVVYQFRMKNRYRKHTA